jgi:hypothetical protein
MLMNDESFITPVEKEVRHTKDIGDKGRGNSVITKDRGGEAWESLEKFC